MRRTLATIAVVLGLLAAPHVRAGLGIAGSIGEGMVLNGGGGDVERSRVNFEVVPSFRIGIVSADLGFVFHLEDQVDLLVRPGVRLDLWVLYARLAFPLRVTDDFDWGIMAGVGATFFDVSVLSLFLEADASFYEGVDFEVVPLEFRLGVEIGF